MSTSWLLDSGVLEVKEVPWSANNTHKTRAIREFIIALKKAPSLLPLSLYLFLFLFLFLHNFISFSLEKKKEFCLVLSLLSMNQNLMRPLPYSSSLLLLSLPSHYSPLLSSRSIREHSSTLIWQESLAGICVRDTSDVLGKSCHKRYEASWGQILNPAGDKTTLHEIILQNIIRLILLIFGSIKVYSEGHILSSL